MDNRCYEFLEGLKSLKYNKDITIMPVMEILDLGFDLESDPVPGADILKCGEEDCIKYRRTFLWSSWNIKSLRYCVFMSRA